MKRPTTPSSKSTRTKKSVLSVRAFEAITSVEGLSLSTASKKRLQYLQKDKTLSPVERRDAVVRAYTAMSHKKR
tara:strand:- start:16328 stop:16549 length:222 start_codon:yes stop_codon:yes gene_type:complete